MKRINIRKETHERCPIDNTYPTCKICGTEMPVSINIKINQTKRLKLCDVDICKKCALDIANKIFDLDLIKKPKTFEEISGEDELCCNCPLPEESQGVHCYGGEPVMCEGRCCKEAYENYVENFEGEE